MARHLLLRNQSSFFHAGMKILFVLTSSRDFYKLIISIGVNTEEAKHYKINNENGLRREKTIKLDTAPETSSFRSQT